MLLCMPSLRLVFLGGIFFYPCGALNDFFLQHSYGPKFYWNNVKQKPRRPLSSIILPGATLSELIADIKDFLKMEDWYMSAGIPHRRGYLLYGPPGTGKSTHSWICPS